MLSPAAGGQLSTCFDKTKVVLYPNEALPRDQALAFCKARHGEAATLPDTPPAIAAAQTLVQRANVSRLANVQLFNEMAWR